MLVLDGAILEEFLSVHELTRLQVFDNDTGGRTLFMVIGSSTYNLRNFIQADEFVFQVFVLEGGVLGYGAYVPDRAEHEPLLWSVVESQEELSLLEHVTVGNPFSVALMNETATNVAKGVGSAVECDIQIPPMLKKAIPCKQSSRSMGVPAERVFETMDGRRRVEGVAATCRVRLDNGWERLESIFLSAKRRRDNVDLFAADEGGQHETVASLLLDSLTPRGVYWSPRLRDSENSRELTDLLLTYERGDILVEAKTVSVASASTRSLAEKATKNAVKDVRKASKQLVGAARRVIDGAVIVDNSPDRAVIELNREQPLHLIVLISSLDLLDGVDEFGLQFTMTIMSKTGAFFHILDPAQLTRLIAAAQYFAARLAPSRMEWFDYFLIKRAKYATEVGHPNFDLRFLPEEVRESADS